MKPQLIAIAIVTGALVAGGAGGGEPPPDGFDVYLKQAGEGLQDCGRVTADTKNRGPVDDCVLRSFAARKPFFVRYDQLGIDSNVAEGLLFSRAKQLVVLHFDDWSCRDPRCTTVERCEGPRILRAKTGIRVECANAYEM